MEISRVGKIVGGGLLTYVAPYWYLLVVSIVGFLGAAGAEAYFGYLFGQLIDSWDDAAVRAAASIPLLMFGAALVRAAGTIVGETLIARVSFNVVFNLHSWRPIPRYELLGACFSHAACLLGY